MLRALRGLLPRTTMPDKDKALTFVRGKIADHKVVVFSKTYCPYCIKAKQALSTIIRPEQMEVIEVRCSV